MKEKPKKLLIPEDDSFLEINKFELDREWVEQPMLYHRYSRKLARCIRELEESEAELELVTAQLGESVRDDPEAYGMRKCTDAAVKEKIPTMQRYKDAIAAVSKAKYNKSLLMGTCNALEQRKTALENLVKLHGADYFAGPKAHGEDREVMDVVEKRRIRSKGRE